jgi:YfiH family protein
MKAEDTSTRSQGLQVLQADALARVPWLVHGFSTRVGGVSEAYAGKALNLGFTRDDKRGAVEQNRAAFLAELGLARSGELWPMTTLRQVHSDIIQNVARAPEHSPTGDGLITTSPGLLLAVQTADCLPVLLVDTERRAVGALHAGWRGTLARIVEKGVGAMRRDFGSNPEDIQAAIGPGIGSCCYAVGDEVRDAFESQFTYAADLFHEVVESDPVREKYPLLFLAARAPGHGDYGRKLHLDLVEANRRQLLAVGVPKPSITVLPMCTACRNELFFSYRVAKGPTGRQMGVVGIRAERRHAQEF